ncbi:MAG: hypothetical protein ACKO7P_00170 [Bacteroidota bacterium]
MNQIEALKFLGIDSLAEAEESIENKIFAIKQEIISSCHVPQLIIAKQKKLKQLISICESLKFNLKTEFDNYQIEPLNSESILESFNQYHKNRALILRKIASNSELNFLIYCCELLLQNLKVWSKKWPNLDSELRKDVKLSKELDSVEMLRLIVEMSSHNIFNFNDLNSVNTQNDLMIDIQRLNELARYFDTIDSN